MNAEDKTRITVDIYGVPYKLAGHSSSSHMRRVAEHVDEQMNRIGKGHPKLDTPRLAVLAAVNIADDYLKLKDDTESKRAGLQHDLAEEQRSLAGEHERLQKECQQAKAKLAAVEARENELKQRMEKLQEEYSKLQTEYNEWTQLVNLDQSEPN